MPRCNISKFLIKLQIIFVQKVLKFYLCSKYWNTICATKCWIRGHMLNFEREMKVVRKNKGQIRKNIKCGNLRVKCLQSLNDLKETCQILGLKFIDCSKSEKFMKIDMILDYKPGVKQDLYLIKWKGYSTMYNSWEPETHLFGCEDLLYYYKALKMPPVRLNEKMVFCFIRDLITRKPRDLLTIIKLCALIFGSTEEYINSLELSFSELKQKVIKVLNIPINKLNKIRDEVLKLMLFSQERKYVLLKIKEWEVKINKFNRPYIVVENNVDLEVPPTDFEFIDDYVSPSIDLSEKPVVFCSCENCYENRVSCCSEVFGGHFAYSRNRRLLLRPGNPIYECNELCRCSKDCINRVVQHGQKIKLAIFRTSNGCGWGLKTLETIQKDQFVMEYLGEIITSDEAEARGELYDYFGHSYLFDLDYQENSLYTVDGGVMGNASHFINHSCDPNMHVFTVWINQHDPNLPRIAFFAKRHINRGEELTFDYRMVDTRTKYGVSVPDEDRILCKCSSKNCKKYLF